MTKYKQRKDYEGFEIPSGEVYKMACCDCGLVHDFVFISEDGKPIGVAAKRNNRATGQRRKNAPLMAEDHRTPPQRPAQAACQAGSAEQVSEREEDLYVINRLATILADVAIALKGPELPLHRHGYHDLAEKAQVLVLERDLLRHQVEELRSALQHTSPAPIIEYQPGDWFKARTIDEMQAFYMSRLPAIRDAAKEHGYAIGLHGSARRDFDLMAMQWRDNASDKDTLAHAVAVAACGITREGAYQWEQKPNGRFAVSIPVCWTDHANPDFKNKPSVGHIDLSIIAPAPTVKQSLTVQAAPEGCVIVPKEPTDDMVFAALEAEYIMRQQAVRIYRAMIEAAQSTAQKDGGME